MLRVAPAVVRSFEAGPDGLDLICIGGRKPKGGDSERFPGLLGLGSRERDREHGPVAVGIGGVDRPAVRVDERGHDRQPQPGAGLAARSRPPSARQKRSKSAAGSSFGNPGPWSRTWDAHRADVG